MERLMELYYMNWKEYPGVMFKVNVRGLHWAKESYSAIREKE